MTNLPSIEPVRSEVRTLATGRRKIRFFRVLGSAVFVLAVVLAVVAWFVTTSTTGWLALGFLAAGVLIAIGGALLLPVDHIAVAKRYDDAVGTKDLLSSSLELQQGAEAPLGQAFVAAVREDAAAATGKARSRDLYPTSTPREVKWLPAPVLAVLVPIFVDWSNEEPPPPPPAPIVRAALDESAAWLEELANRAEDALADLRLESIQKVKNLSDALKEKISKRDAMAELARLASQLDKERKDLESRRMELEKNAAKLARGEDAKDARRDMDAGRYREAANKIKKKLAKLEEELAEKLRKKAGKMEIEKIKKRIAKLKELLAELEKLDALGQELGFLVETLEALDRIEGQLGELGEFDGEEFDEAQLGRMRRPRNAQQQDGQQQRRLLVMPSSEAGKGHSKKVLGGAKRALSDGDENEARLREGKGKSTFGQVKTANDGSRSRTAFQEALMAAKRDADDVIYRQNIPVGYRNYIRRYFEIMQPDDRTRPAGSGEGR